MILRLLILVIFGWLSEAVPIDWDDSKCAQKCNGGSKYQYSEGNIYTFSYESSSELKAPKSSDLSVKLKATVSLTVISKCEMLLQVSDVHLTHGSQPDASSSLIGDLERHPLPFSWDDGRIEYVCPNPEDSDDVNNIKKSILSALQNTMKEFHFGSFNVDTDILGTCDTEYKTKATGDEKYEIKKIKNVPTCSNHLNIQTILLLMGYTSSSHHQHLPFLSNEKAECNQTINGGMIEGVTCSESATFNPLGNLGYVVEVEGHSKIEALKEKPVSNRILYKTPRKESLEFKHQVSSHKNEKAEAEARAILHHICENSESLITKDVASYVHKLVYTIRQMTSGEVENVYKSLKNGEICRKGRKAESIYLDSLRMASSGSSITLLSKLAISGQMSFVDSLLWTTMMPFTAYVEEESVAASLPLIDKDVTNRQYLLGTTALAYKYCSISNNCEDKKAVKDMSSKLLQLLGNKCHTNGIEDETQILTVLKAFGNLGFFQESASAVLDCAKEEKNKIEIRIAAVEAFRRSPCMDDVTSKLLDIYSSKTENDEVRMAALTSLSRCPSLGVIKKIAETYHEEGSRQVQVFTWSFIENLRFSSDPVKAKIKTYISGIHLSEPDSTDITKFARYFESSFFSELFNLGHVIEGSVRHSSDSFLPKSGSLGLKFDFFGNQLDALTVGTRVEGLEHVLEKIFGPSGIFANVELKDLMKLIPENLMRNKRSPDLYQTKIDALTERIGYKRDKVPHSTAFVRIMGHELGLIRLNEESLKRVAGMKLHTVLNNLASLKDIDTSKNLLFVDLSVLVPSITGMGYKLAVNGSLTIGLKADGKIDLRQSNFPRPRTDIDGKFHPSILGEVTAKFFIHSRDFEPGVKVSTVLNAGESFKGKVEIKNNLVHWKLKREKQRSEILSFKRTLYYTNDKGETEMAKPASHNLNYCTKYLQTVLGARYCASLTIPHLYENGKYKIPFVRAMEANLVVEETDSSMEGYEFLLEIPELGDTQERRFRILLDTPNSSEDRKFSIDIHSKHASDNSLTLSANFYSRIYSLDVSSDMMNTNDHLRFNVEIIGDKRRKYALNVNSEKIVKGARLVEYKPNIKLSLPSVSPIELTGTIVFSKGRKEQLSINLESRSFQSPFTIKGNLAKEGEAINLRSNWKLTSEFNINAFSQIHRIHGRIGYILEKGLLLDFGHHYEPDGRSYESVTFNAKVDNIKVFGHLGFNIDSKILFAEHQDLNTMLKWDFSFKPLEHLRSDFIFRYGENFDDDTHLVRMTIASALAGDFINFQKMNIENKVGLTISCLHFDRSASAVAVWDFTNQPKFIVEAGIKSGTNKEMKFEFKYSHLEPKPLKLATEMTITCNTYKFMYRDEVKEIGPGEYQLKALIEPMRNKQITADFIYRIKSAADFHHEIDGQIQFPGLYQPVRQKGLLKFSDTELDFNSETDFGRGAVYIFEGKSLKVGGKNEVKFSTKTPFIEGKVIVEASGTSSQNVRADFKTKDNQRLIITGNLLPGERTVLELAVQWNTERSAAKKIDIKLEIHKDTENGIEKHIISSSVNYVDSINLNISGKISTDLIRGPHFFKAELSGNMEPIAIEFEHKIKGGQMNTVTRYLRSEEEKLRLEMKGKFIHRGFNHFEVEFGAFLSSPYKTFDGKLIFFRLLADSNDDMRLFVTEYRIKFSEVIGYDGKIDYQRKRGWPGQITSNLLVSVHNKPLYEGSTIIEYGNNKYSFKSSFTPISKKKIHFIASFEHTSRFVAFHHSIVAANLYYVQKVEMNAVADLRNFEDAKMYSNVEVNNHKLYDVNTTVKIRSAFDFDIEMTMFSKITPSLRIFSKSQASGQVSKFSMNLDIDSNSVMTGSGEIKKRKRGFLGNIVFKYKENEILTLVLNQDGKGRYERNYSFKLKFPSRLYTSNIKVNKREKGTVNYETKFCRNELCIEIDAIHKEYNKGNEWQIKYKRDDIEINIERIRESYEDHERFHTVLYKGNNRFGYDIKIGRVETTGHFLSLGIILPRRTIITKGTMEFSLSKPRLKLEFSIDGKNHPDRKLITDIRLENHIWDNNPSKLDISIAHPVFEKPIEIEISADYEPSASSKVLTADVSLDYSNDPDDKLIAQMHVERKKIGTETILINVYHKDLEHLDFVIKVNETFNKNENEFSIVYNWKDENNADAEAHVIFGFPKKENRFFFEYKRPRIIYRLDGKVVSQNSLSSDIQQIDLESNYNGDVTKAKFVSNYDTGCYTLTIFDDEDEGIARVVELCYQLGNRNTLSFLTESYDDEGHWTLDYLTQVVQKDWRTIGVRTQANPEFVGKYLLSDDLTSRGVGTLPFHDSHRFKLIRQSFNSKVLKPAKAFFIPELKNLFSDLKNDALFLQNALTNYYKKLPLFDVLKEKFVQLTHLVKAASLHIYTYYEEYIRKYHQYVDTFIKATQDKCKNNNECRSLVEAFQTGGWKAFLEEIRSQLISLPGKILKFLENPTVEFDKYFKSAVNVLKELVQPLTKYRCGELVVKAAKLSYEKYYPQIQDFIGRVPNYYKMIKDRISSDPYVQTMCKFLEDVYYKVWDEVMNFDYGKLHSAIKVYIEEYLVTASPPTIKDSVKINELNLENFLVDMNLKLNVLNMLSQRFQSFLVAIGRKSIRTSYFNSYTFFINFKRALDLNFIPPYETQGMILSHKHFITYDKAFYDFAGKCTYLLTRDFQDGNFTVALKPNDGGDASIVLLKGHTSIELNSGQSSVKVGDSSVDLPYISKDFVVTREGNSITADTMKGFKVKCNLIHEICTFVLSGWYHGKTAGLLGTYNYEHYDEFRRPKGQIANSVAVFAKSYELKRGCKTSNLVQDVQINKNSNYYKQCHALFETRTSPMAACFSEVSPGAYLKLCLRLSAREDNSKSAVCNAAAAYVMECEHNYVELNLPSQCLTCDAPDGSKLEHGDQKKFEKITKRSADVIFLVEDNDCNKVILGDIGHLARSIEKELQNEGEYRDISFGVVGFGGDIVDPKIFTSGKDKILFGSRDINAVMQRFKLQSKKVETISKAFDAIKYAVIHLFRSDTSKSIILLSCSSCKFDYTSLQYPVIEQILLQRGIILHVIRGDEIKIRKYREKNIIGMDPDTVFHAKDVTQRVLVGEPALRSQVSVPKDLCIALSQDVNGSFFSTHPISKSSSSDIKNWRNVFARKFLRSTQMPQCQTCDCNASRDHVPHTVCQPCETRRPRLPFSVGTFSVYSRTVEPLFAYILHAMRQ